MTICKSATDEYINSDSVYLTPVFGGEEVEFKKKDDDEEEEVKKVLSWKTQATNTTQVRAQEIDLNYPCLVSNVGLSRVNIQSMTCPDTVATFKLDDLGMDFVCFADYQSLDDIGFKDNRTAEQIEAVPSSECGDKIAFLTRKFNANDDPDYEPGDSAGDMLLNVLSIDSYSIPMKFELFTTKYEACMDEGMSDDSI